MLTRAFKLLILKIFFMKQKECEREREYFTLREKYNVDSIYFPYGGNVGRLH